MTTAKRMTATSTAASLSQPTTATQTHTQYVDIGNYTVQSLTSIAPDDVLTVRSLVHTLTVGEPIQASKRSSTSPLIVYGRNTYHAGEATLSYSNGAEATMKCDKTLLAKQVELLLTVAIEGSVNLVITVPDPYESTQTLNPDGSVSLQSTVAASAQGLVGDYSFIRNGVDINTSVKNVTVIQEGLPAVLKARRDGHVANYGTTVCLDIGGKTCNLLVVDDIGDVVGYMSMLGQGGIKLATALQSNQLYRARCKRANVKVPGAERIMSAIGAGRMYVGSNDAATWADIFNAELGRWYTSLVGDVEATLGDLDSDLTGMMLTGGNANLLHDFVDSNVFIPKSPEQFNITALSQL